MARTYCQWRNGDMPTKAQWEKAARGTGNRWFPWGDVLDGKHANFNDVNSSTDGGRKDLNDG
jgi:sulfatase modifying factor 1